MNTGHPSKAALGAARIALLAGVSAAAIFAAGAANAQTPLGLVGESTVPQILEDVTGTPITVAGNVDGSGKVIATYASETNYAALTAFAGLLPANTFTGTFTAGDVALTSTGALATVAGDCTIAHPCTFAHSTATDPNIKFAAPTYANETNAPPSQVFAGTAPAHVTGTYVAGDVAVTDTGVLAIAAGDCTATHPCSFVPATQADPKATAALLAVAPADMYVNPGVQKAYSLTPGGTQANLTQTFTGGVVYSNSTSQATTAGPGGVQIIDLAKGQTTVSASGLVTVDNHGNGTALTAGNLLLTSSAGYVSISADPTITVSNGTAAGTTTINNGTVVAGTSVSAPVVNSIVSNSLVSNIGTANVGTTNTGNLHVAPGGTVDMGGNRVENVGTPIAATDATNKAYVDKGLNKAYEGTAIALAISQPVFLPGQTFAVRGGWGDFEGQNAFGVSAAGVVAHNVFGYGSTVSLDAGIGAGNSSVAGKAGVTVGFGGGSAPLK